MIKFYLQFKQKCRKRDYDKTVTKSLESDPLSALHQLWPLHFPPCAEQIVTRHLVYWIIAPFGTPSKSFFLYRLSLLQPFADDSGRWTHAAFVRHRQDSSNTDDDDAQPESNSTSLICFDEHRDRHATEPDARAGSQKNAYEELRNGSVARSVAALIGIGPSSPESWQHTRTVQSFRSDPNRTMVPWLAN